MNESSPANLPARRRAVETLEERWSAEPEKGGINIDVRAIWSAVYRNRLLIAALVGAALVAGVAIIFLSRPIYRATAKLQIEQQNNRVIQGDDVSASGSDDADRYLQTQLDVMQSRSLAERVARDQGLFDGPGFIMRMGGKPPVGGTDADRENQVIGILQDHLKVSLPVDSRVASIAFTSPDAGLAASIANSYADQFILSNLNRKFDATAYARKFLSEQLDTLRRKVETSERSLIGYARAESLIDTGDTGSGSLSGTRSLVTSNLVQINKTYSDALTARLAAQQSWATAAHAPLLAIPEVQADATIQSLVQQRARAMAQYEQDSKRYRADFPSMVQETAQIRGLDRQIDLLANRVKAVIHQRYLVAQAQEKALTGSLTTLKAQTLSEQDRAVQYNILRREVDTNRALYDALLGRFKEVSAAAGVNSSNISVVDRAEAPGGPIWPRPLLILAGCALLGLLASGGLIFVREHLDDAVRSPEDMEGKLGLAVVGSTPFLPAGVDPRDELDKPRSPLSEAYYAIRTALELSGPTGLPRTLMFTSSAASEGKSTTAFAIARDFAKVGRRVLLIDSDLRKPTQDRFTGTSNEVGLANLLARQRSRTEVTQASAFANLDVIPTGPLPLSPAELLASPDLARLLEQMALDYDLVVVDAPPVMGFADAPALAAVVEGTVMVVEANRASRGQAKASVRRLRAARANMIGGILTKYDVRMTGYGSGYGYGYGYGYEYGAKTDELQRS